MTEPRYSVGIDLGTTHCALAYAELDAGRGDETVARVLDIPQVVDPGRIEAQALLPSFLYLAHPDELKPSDLTLPWGASAQPALEQPQADAYYVTGELARRLGGPTPTRLVASAKSWLCHPGVDRRSPILPIDGPEDLVRVSPLDASVRLLEHLRDAFQDRHPGARLADQDVTLTVPASFDPAARELTAEAAQRAGLLRLTLLEEPQAALYSWVQQSHGGFRNQASKGDVILVVDVGGGTTDLSLIAVTDEGGALGLARIAVGDHILLGGDNMDLALAHAVKQKLEAQGKKLDAWQLRALTHGCRTTKERLLGDDAVDVVPVVVPSRGSKLIGGSLRTELSRDDVHRVVLEGFFPMVAADAVPQHRARVGLTQLGLPYAQDAAITRHLAAFLARHRSAMGAGSKVKPTLLLLNGGVLKAPAIAERLVATINGWLAADGEPPIAVLDGADLDLACARGAAYYGIVRQQGGLRIRGGAAKAFYVGVEAAVPAVPGMEPPITAICLSPFGLEEGSSASPLPQEVGLVVGEPVRFRFFGSSVRRDDRVGTVLDSWLPDELEELDAIEVDLPADGRTPGEVVPVRLVATITEVGTLRLDALARGVTVAGAGSEAASEGRWKVELVVRGDS